MDYDYFLMCVWAVHEFERLQKQLQQQANTLPRQKHCEWNNVLGCVVQGSDMLWYRGRIQELIEGYMKVRIHILLYNKHVSVCNSKTFNGQNNCQVLRVTIEPGGTLTKISIDCVLVHHTPAQITWPSFPISYGLDSGWMHDMELPILGLCPKLP